MCTSFSRGARYLTPATSLRDARYLTSRGCRRPDGRRRSCSLLRVELNDELFLDLRVDLRADRQRVDQDAHLVGDDLQPGRHRALARFGLGHDARRHVARLRPNLDDVVLGHAVRRDVDLAAVDRDVAVGGELTGHVPALGEAGPVHHVVQAALQDLEQVVARAAVTAGGLFVVVVELPLQHPVHPPSLLLLADLQEILTLLGAVPAVLTRGVGPDLNRALRRIALRALQEQLHLLAAATLAVRAGVSSHLLSLTPSDPAPLRRPAAIVRNRGDVLNGANLQAGRLQGPDGGLAAGAGTLDEYVDLAHAVLHGTARGGFSGHLRGERRGLTRALEPHLPGRGPCDDGPGRVSDGNDRVVERAPDVGVPVSYVLPLFAAHLLGARVAAPRRHLLLTPEVIGRAAGDASGCGLLLAGLLLAGHGLLLALAGAGVGLRPLTMHGQSPTVPDPLVAADLDLASDIGLDFAAQVALDAVGRVDPVAQANQVLFG